LVWKILPVSKAMCWAPWRPPMPATGTMGRWPGSRCLAWTAGIMAGQRVIPKGREETRMQKIWIHHSICQFIIMNNCTCIYIYIMILYVYKYYYIIVLLYYYIIILLYYYIIIIIPILYTHVFHQTFITWLFCFKQYVS
jgi:hypothetical protein